MKLEHLQEGDVVELDSGFTCMDPGSATVRADPSGRLYLPCADGRHYLDGQQDQCGELVGLSWPETAHA